MAASSTSTIQYNAVLSSLLCIIYYIHTHYNNNDITIIYIYISPTLGRRIIFTFCFANRYANLRLVQSKLKIMQKPGKLVLSYPVGKILGRGRCSPTQSLVSELPELPHEMKGPILELDVT